MGEQQQEAQGVGARARRMLKDSGRFLLAGVRAALADGQRLDFAEVLDAWVARGGGLERREVDLARLAAEALTRASRTSAELGVDLLVERGQEAIPCAVDETPLAAALEAVVDRLVRLQGQGAAVRARCAAGPEGPSVTLTVLAAPDAGQGRTPLGVALEVEDPTYACARDVVTAHGGAVTVEDGPGGGGVVRIVLT